MYREQNQWLLVEFKYAQGKVREGSSDGDGWQKGAVRTWTTAVQLQMAINPIFILTNQGEHMAVADYHSQQKKTMYKKKNKNNNDQ